MFWTGNFPFSLSAEAPIVSIDSDKEWCRFGCSPLDDAIRHGNSVAALALELAGGLQSCDQRVALQVSGARVARTRWWQNARRKTVAETVARSPESTVWSSAEQYSLPPLHSLLERIMKVQEKLETHITEVLKILHYTFERAVVLTAQEEQTQASFGEQHHKKLNELEKETRTQAGGVENSRGAISEIECALALALESISSFFSHEMEEAKEALSIESLTRGRYLQQSCARFSRSIHALRAQVKFHDIFYANSYFLYLHKEVSICFQE
jgi:hypothetical protein